MKHQRNWFAYGVGCAAIALGVGCAKDAYTDLQIKQVQVLGGDSGDNCSVPGTATTLQRLGGTLDLALPDGSTPPYYLPILVVNNMPPVGASPAEEMNNITVQHFTVELSAPGVSWGADCPATFDTQAMTDTIPPGGSSGVALYIIQVAHSRCLQPQVPPQGLAVAATITAKGRHGGTGIESAPFIYTVDVCRGCLQTGYGGAAAPYRYNAPTPSCSLSIDSTLYAGDRCLPPGQDATILCCALDNDTVLCPGAFTGTDTSTSTSTGP